MNTMKKSLFLIFFVIVQITSPPTGYKSFDDFSIELNRLQHDLSKVKQPEVVDTSSSTSSNPYQLIYSLWNILISMASSMGIFCSCWCGIKWIHNGFICKSRWFYPKSINTYKQRKENNQSETSQAQGSTKSSSSPCALLTLTDEV